MAFKLLEGTLKESTTPDSGSRFKLLEGSLKDSVPAAKSGFKLIEEEAVKDKPIKINTLISR